MVHTTGFTLWLTGMSGAGKSTIAAYLGSRFRAIGRKAEVLDQDEVGSVLTAATESTKEEQELGIARLGFVANLLTRNDCVAIVASVSPHREGRDKIRKEVGRFVEIFVDCPTETLIERDTKGVYKKALAGELPNFTGVTEPYDTPQHAEVTVRTDAEPVEASAERIVQALVNIGYLNADEARGLTGKRIRSVSEAKPKRTRKAPGSKPKAKRRVQKAKAKRAARRKGAKRARRK